DQVDDGARQRPVRERRVLDAHRLMTSLLPDVLGPAARSRFPHRARALFGLYTDREASHDEFTRGLSEWHSRASEARGARLRVGVRIPGTEQMLQESIGAYFDEPIAPLDGFATIDVEHPQPAVAQLDELVEVVGGIAEHLRNVVDRGRSFAM